MGARIEDCFCSRIHEYRDCRRDKNQEDGYENNDGGNGHFPRFNLFTEILRGSPDHEPGNEHRDDDKNEHDV